MTLDEARAIYKRAEVTAGLASEEWVRLYDAAVGRPQVGARDAMTGEVQVLATVERGCAYDDEELLFNAPLFLRAVLMVAQEAFEVIRRQKREIETLQAKKEKASLAQQCAIACGDAAFLRWLFEVHGVETTDRIRVATRVRTMLAVQSRAELDTDPQAAARWRKMYGDFKQWMKGR
ncbi:hypothetical protein [Ciceribacter thiooxidans]|uniref:Uncharacterized protein n=1 Tax=Ciceribacter thiooxidans TaxID=1969821 RepID=A0ABV7HXF7_9HYPH|nr:hypothetical protein [Ciceribacter thiooxidans]